MAATDIQWTDVVAIAPQLNTPLVPIAGRTQILAYVNNVRAMNYGGATSPQYKSYRVNLAAHFGELVRRRGQGGDIRSELVTASEVEVSYDFTAMSARDQFALTTYGAVVSSMQAQSLGRLGFVL